jgi:mRNA-degrading endonuclease toxin of MazEF toxin-antitoxin module
LGIPLTKTAREGIFYHSFEFKEGINSTVLLSQIRLFDAKRLHYRIGMINKDDFEMVKGKLKVLLEVTP